MARPPLEYQIDHLDRIVVCATAAEGLYLVEEVLKGARNPRKLRPDLEIFKQLGYVPVLGEQAVLFMSDAARVVELLPVKDGWVDYAPEEASARRRLPLHEMKALVRGSAAPAPGSRVKSRTAFWALTFFAGAAVVFGLRELGASREALSLFEMARVTGRCEALSPPAKLSYRFEAAGSSYDAHDRPVHSEAWSPLKVGQPIEVYYDPARPSRNVSEPERSIHQAAPRGAIPLFVVAAAFFAGGLFLLRVGGIPDATRR